jgi:hypothetical protein
LRQEWNFGCNPPNYIWFVVGTMEGSSEIPRAFHRQEILPGGVGFITGGLRAPFTCPTQTTLFHYGLSQPFGADIGTNVGIPGSTAMPLAFHAMTELYDGSFLLSGGITRPNVFCGPPNGSLACVSQAWTCVP